MVAKPMLRNLLLAAFVVPFVALAQGEPAPKIVIVPYPGEYDAGVAVQPGVPDQGPTTAQPPPPQPDVPPAEPPQTRTIEALTPQPPPEPVAQPNVATPPDMAGAFLDGHPREGAFLSGPGSFAFIMHHSLMASLGMLATQMVPRAIDAYCIGATACTPNADIFTGQDARIAYLAGTLIGAGVGFGAAATWQFFHWMNWTTATFGVINSAFGGMFMFGLVDIFTHNATVLSWLMLIGAEAGAWLTAIIGTGDLPFNKGLLIASGGMWGLLYTALLLGIVASTGSGSALRSGIDALMITPAIGAAAMAIATLKFNPSTMQIWRANIFGVGAGAAVLLLSALVLGGNFASPVPYILAMVAAVGAKTVVSLLWAEAAEQPPSVAPPATQLLPRAPRGTAVVRW
jgi:hypothetical protein